MRKLSPQAKACINKFILGGISRKIIVGIINAKNNEDLIQSLSQLHNIDKEKEKAIWFHTITKVWDSEDESTVFNEQESIFFKELLKNRGFLKKTSCYKISVLGTEYKIKNTANFLQELGLIDIITLGNKEVVYLLNLESYREVLSDGKQQE